MNWIRRLFKKTNEPQDEAWISKRMDKLNKNIEDEVNVVKFPRPVKVVGEGKKNIILVDDITSQIELFEDDIKDIEDRYIMDVKKEYTIYFCEGIDAGFQAYKVLEELDDLYGAVIDITIGNQLKLSDGTIEKLDGGNLLVKALRKFPTANVKLLTAHYNSRNNPILKDSIEVLESNGYNFNEYYRSKYTQRFETVLEILGIES